MLALELGIQQIPSWESLPQGVLTKEDIRGHIRRWKSQVVIPAIQQQEFEWKQRACSKIGWEPPPPIAPQSGDDEEYVLDTPTGARVQSMVFRHYSRVPWLLGGGKEETSLM